MPVTHLSALLCIVACFFQLSHSTFNLTSLFNYNYGNTDIARGDYMETNDGVVGYYILYGIAVNDSTGIRIHNYKLRGFHLSEESDEMSFKFFEVLDWRTEINGSIGGFNQPDVQLSVGFSGQVTSTLCTLTLCKSAQLTVLGSTLSGPFATDRTPCSPLEEGEGTLAYIDSSLDSIYESNQIVAASFCNGGPVREATTFEVECSNKTLRFPKPVKVKFIKGIDAATNRRKYDIFGLFESLDGKRALCAFSNGLATGGILKSGNRTFTDFNGIPEGFDAVSTVNEDFLTFVTLADGQIYKIIINDAGIFQINYHRLQSLSDISTRVNPDAVLHKDVLYLSTQDKIFAIDVNENCSSHMTLCECRTPKDPKCGWCVATERCTEMSQCGAHWIIADASEVYPPCVNISLDPISSARTEPRAVDVIINSEDSSGFGLQSHTCYYVTSDGSVAKQAVKPDVRSAIQCPAIELSEIDNNFPGQSGGLTIPLVIRNDRTAIYVPNVIQYRLVVCSEINDCLECVESHDSCTWCKNEFKCTDTTSVDCPAEDQLAEHIHAPFGEPRLCPSIQIASDIIPYAQQHTVRTTINQFQHSSLISYQCVVHEGTATRILSAERNGNEIECQQTSFRLASPNRAFEVGEIAVDVIVNRDEKHVLGSVNAVLYDCKYYKVCTRCLTTLPQYNCLWCNRELSPACGYSTCDSETDEIRVASTCPVLNINEALVLPRAVPKEGDFELRIEGGGLVIGNLGPGDLFPDAEITLNENTPCTDVTVVFKSSIADQNDVLSCILPAMLARGKANLTVVINNVGWVRNEFLMYYDPEITSLITSPRGSYGPLFGKTEFQIVGRDLDYLSNATSQPWVVDFIRKNDTTQVIRLNCSRKLDVLSCLTPEVAQPSRWTPRLTFSRKGLTRDISSSVGEFEYKPNPVVSNIDPSTIFKWGGVPFTVSGTAFNSALTHIVKFQDSPEIANCSLIGDMQLSCIYPRFIESRTSLATVKLDGVEKDIEIVVRENPIFFNFTEKNGIKDFVVDELVLKGTNLEFINDENTEVKVGSKTCNITTLNKDVLICVPPFLKIDERDDTSVKVSIDGLLRYVVGKLNYEMVNSRPPPAISIGVIAGITVAVIVVIIAVIIVAICAWRRSRYHKQRYLNMIRQVDHLETSARQEIKQAFAELQTDMTDLMVDLESGSAGARIPYWDYKNYTFKVLFPGQTDHPSLHKLMTKRKQDIMHALDKFEHLVYNRHFLISFIHTLESQPTFTMQDKVQLASLLMLTLQHRMDYATSIIKELLSELIETSIKKRHPKLLLRRSECVVEKMLTHWLSLCLYQYLQDHAGTPLFLLFKAIKIQIEKGPVDALTGEARYSLAQDRLIKEKVDPKPVTVDVHVDSKRLQVKVNDCDTITQVKNKILDSRHKNEPYSSRPLAYDYNLNWCKGDGSVAVTLSDEDLTSENSNGWKRLNTLSHYGITDHAEMYLAPRHSTHSLHSERGSKGEKEKFFDTISTRGGTPKNTLSRSHNHGSMGILQDHFNHSHIQIWHLTKSQSVTPAKEGETQTLMSEIFLTRLLKTKGALQDFIDKLFETIFSAKDLPPTVKYLFDFLDNEAHRNGITDPETIHVWKNNSLNLRFWVNVIKNPEFVFDINKTEVVDSSLSAIAQTFIDSCAYTEQDFGTDAPVNKLLFTKDRPKYRKLVQTFNNDVRNQPPIDDRHLNEHLNALSMMHPKEFYRNSCLKEIHQYAQRYQRQIVENLEDEFHLHKNPNLITLLKDVGVSLDEGHTPTHDFV